MPEWIAWACVPLPVIVVAMWVYAAKADERWRQRIEREEDE